MHSGSFMGGSFEIEPAEPTVEETRLIEMDSLLHQGQHSPRELEEIKRGWLLKREDVQKKMKKTVNLGCMIVSQKAFMYALLAIVVALVVFCLPAILTNLPKQEKVAPPDNYTLALHKALLFFNAQKFDKFPKDNGIPWRGDSGLQDGDADLIKQGLVGGYYDAGDNTKFHFPLSFSMTMLSWSTIEYEHKYHAIGEYDHIRDLIKWGTDYLLLTFNLTTLPPGLIEFPAS